MKVNIKTLKAKGENLSQYDIGLLEKELQNRFIWLSKNRDLNVMIKKELMKMLQEILGE